MHNISLLIKLRIKYITKDSTQTCNFLGREGKSTQKAPSNLDNSHTQVKT